MQAAEQHQQETAHEVKPQLVGGLTDTVFGVAITLLATSLSINSSTPTPQILQQLFGFAGSFLIIAVIWLRRFQLLRWMRVEPPAFIRLNFALLALVVSYTYVLRLFTLSGTKGAGEFALFLFAILSASVWGVMASLAQVALHTGVVMSRYRRQTTRMRDVSLLTCGGFALAGGLVFLSLQAASIMLTASFGLGRLYRLVLERRQRREERQAKLEQRQASKEIVESGAGSEPGVSQEEWH
jgi:uncharacterized membrane protein